MEFQDKVLKCVDCGGEFIFTSGEQSFFQDKQFRNDPKRCKACKAKRVAAFGTATAEPQRFSTKAATDVICAGCGKATDVPFRPSQGRPVFCRECFRSRPSVPA